MHPRMIQLGLYLTYITVYPICVDAFVSEKGSLLLRSQHRLTNLPSLQRNLVTSTLHMSNLNSITEEYERTITVKSTESVPYQRNTVFDFTDVSNKNISLDSFERIDDAIMGGISLSKLADVQGQDYVRWNGVCRTDGGGFCGMRTRPMIQPLNATNQDGIYITCRLASDNEPERRVWKVSLRTDESRGEMMLYQAAFTIPPQQMPTPQETVVDLESSSSSSSTWTTIQIPFTSFQMVRGPVAVINGPSLNLTRGIYQIGLIMSKFKIGPTMTEMDNFRSGYFDLHIQQIGFYKHTPFVDQSFLDKDVSSSLSSLATVYPKSNKNNTRTTSSSSPLFQILSPLLQFVFSEQANRRRSAMKIITQQRGMNLFQAIQFGIQLRRKSLGYIPSMIQTLRILCLDGIRSIMKWIVRCTIFYPLRLLSLVRKRISKK